MTEASAALTYEELSKYLKPEERDELLKLLAQDKRLFYPTPGPQYLAAVSKADILGFGGAAGGGKSYLISGLALTEHKRSAIFRQFKNQTQKFVQDFARVLGDTTGYTSQHSAWRHDGRLIEFAGLEDPKDYEKWQGRDHDLKCVGAGTLIWMADGSKRAIEDVRVGDMVDTLEGPRPVSRTMRRFHKPTVRIETEQGSQVQSADHRILTPEGWTSCDDLRCPSVSSSPTSRHALHTAEGSSDRTYSLLVKSLGGQSPGEAPRPAPLRDREDRPASSGASADKARTGPGNAIARWSASIREAWRLVLSLRPIVVLPPLHPGPVVFASARSGAHDAAFDARPGSGLRDFQANYSSDPHRRDEPLRLSEEAVRQGPRRPAGVERRSPRCWLVDECRHTPRRNRHAWSYDHPYTKETRRSDRTRHIACFRIFDVGVQTLFDLTVEGANHYLAGPGFVNSNCYDEATQMREFDVRYTMGWCRSDDPSQRCRVIMTFNPPTTAEGRWVIKFFAPWLDKSHPNPAKPGELRWFTTIDGNQDYETPDGRPFVRDRATGEFLYEFDPADWRPEEIVQPKSRTFIPSRVSDNPYYMATGYIAQLQSLPEPLRSQMLEGDFMAGVEDDARQVIPTAWIEMAQERWKRLVANPQWRKGPMDSLGVDAARGGNMGGTGGMIGRDKMVMTPRHGVFFGEQVVLPGVDVNTGNLAAAQVIAQRRDDAPIHLDVVSIGTSVFDALEENRIYVVPLNGTAKSFGLDKSNQLRFYNKRAELHWRMREALDPAGDEPAALPPDPELLADLAAPRWTLTAQGIKIEAKDEIKSRIGRSPDKGESAIYANVTTPKREMIVGGLRGLSSVKGNYERERLRELEQ